MVSWRKPIGTTLTIQYNLGLLWRLTGDKRYAARAAAELLHVTTVCTTWDPYGLVLAEMTCVCSICVTDVFRTRVYNVV